MNEYIQKIRQHKAWIFLSKYGIWIAFAGIWIYNFYNWYQDPTGTWERTKENLHSPWFWIPLCFFVLSGIVILVSWIWDKYKLEPQRRELADQLKESFRKSAEETAKLRSGEMPTDEDIDKYYRMYCKKFELDNRDQWTTLEPMPFEEFETEAKKEEPDGISRVGWGFLISMTSDAFTFDPGSGQSTMMRFRDYESMIEE